MPPLPLAWRILLAGVVFMATFLLGLWHNDFPWTYHNDESSKVSQVILGHRNLHHPPLMVDLALIASRVTGAGTEPQAVVMAGRILSAAYLALAFALLVDLAVIYAGPIAGALLGALLLLNAGFFEIAHYFKEDTLLLACLAGSFWMLAAFARHPSPVRCALLGLVLACLAGSKYVGWLWVAVIGIEAIIYIWRQRNRIRLIAWLAGAFAAASVVIYWYALRHPYLLGESGELEMRWLTSGDYGTGLPIPHGLYWKDLCDEFSAGVIVIGVATFSLAGAKRPPGGAAMVLSSILLIIIMSCLPKYSDRYVLPVSLLAAFVVITGPVLLLKRWLGETFWSRIAGVLAATAMTAVLVLFDAPVFAQRYAAFATDSRAELHAWLATHTLGPVVLAEDEMVQLGTAPEVIRVENSFFAADVGTLDALRARGVTHVAVSFDVYHRYIDGSVPGRAAINTELARRREFYGRLFKEGVIVWQDEPRQPKTLHPGLTLVELRKPEG